MPASSTPPGGGNPRRSELADLLVRLPRLVVGLALFGAGLALIVRGGFGQGPWTVFHEGVSIRTPLSIGTATIATGALIVGIVLGFREPIGVGTIANVVVIGLSTDATLALVDRPDGTLTRAGLTLVAPLLVAIGSGLYLGARLGPGPRDGLMTGLNKRGVPIWKARFGIEAVPFTLGFLLGGTIGLGTVWWLLVIGPAVQVSMAVFDRKLPESAWSDITRRDLTRN
jgi:uncharacterized membrane protein YczE